VSAQVENAFAGSESVRRAALKILNWRLALWVAGIALLFRLFTLGITTSTPGFYVDESGLAYNAYLVSRTGAGEFGPRFPLYFEFYTNGFTQYCSPTQVYLLAIVFRVFGPSIFLARMFSALWIFSACLLLGLLAKRVSGRNATAMIVTAAALLTPWLFEARGILMEPHFVPFAVTVFLLAVYEAQKSESWGWQHAIILAGSLALLTYCYTSGRLLGGLFAVGLFSFATSRQRLVAVGRTWVLYGLTLIPLLIYNLWHPGILTRRLYEISYIRPGMALNHIASEFVRRYLEDQSLTGLLLIGDYHPRHHVPGSGGAILFATFLLAAFGLLLVISRGLRDPWWRFVAYGLAVSVVPGAITIEPFHQMRLMAYPVFLLLLMVPALEWAMGRETKDAPRHSARWSAPFDIPECSRSTRLALLVVLLVAMVVQAFHFQTIFRRDGPQREFDFDVPYKAAYDAAVAQPGRPIYLEDGFWGPAYIHAFWYAAVEGRPLTEFAHLEAGKKAPPGGVVISSAQNCKNCEVMKRSGVYLLYKSN